MQICCRNKVFLFCEMINFSSPLMKFSEKGEKSGWTYVKIPSSVAARLHDKDKRSFRVKGSIGEHSFSGLALLPMGEGDYILPVNADMQKAIGKRAGAIVELRLEKDSQELRLPPELLECLSDEPGALDHFNNLKKGERNYFIKWICAARTDETRSKRMAMSIEAFLAKLDFGAMIRNNKGKSFPGE
jgi:hypothetical protein